MKWFNGEKGYGFITAEDGGADLFVHHSEVKTAGYANLDEGQKVEYTVGEGKKAAHGIHQFLSKKQPEFPTQHSRLGHKPGASGSGLLHPIRAHELEAALAKKISATNGGKKKSSQ